MNPQSTPAQPVTLSAAAIEFLLHATPLQRTAVTIGADGPSIFLVRR